MPHWPKGNSNKNVKKFELGKIIKVLNRLGNPHFHIPPIIHVTGTNGKGSSIAFLFSILKAAGYVSHVYTSPHLIDVNERIVVANQKITDGNLYNILEEVRSAADDIELSFFEALTVAAFVVFSQNKADFTLLEVGMGGRLDATNVVVNTLVAIFTSVSFDHTEFLGKSIKEIACEKSYIMRKNAVAVIGKQTEGAMQFLIDRAIVNKTYVFRYGLEWSIVIDDNGSVIFKTQEQTLELPRPSLEGRHQIENAGNAIAASYILNSRYNYNITFEDICDGMCSAIWPSRLTRLVDGMLYDKLPNNLWSLYIDGAHNDGGAKVIADWIEENYKDKEVYLIAGLTRGKDRTVFFQSLRPYIKLVCCVCVKSETNAFTVEEVSEFVSSAGIDYKPMDSIKDSIDFITDNAKQGLILICGSLYLTTDFYRENGK